MVGHRLEDQVLSEYCKNDTTLFMQCPASLSYSNAGRRANMAGQLCTLRILLKGIKTMLPSATSLKARLA